MKRRKMYAVEYMCSDGSASFDIFETLEEAEKHCDKNFVNDCGEKIWGKDCVPLFIFSADFNVDDIFTEENENGVVIGWNYEEHFDMIENYEIIRQVNGQSRHFIKF